MNINKITLNNIRSYHHQEIHLPTGTTLLSGNVGAGKSTILHAIEFALFGIIKGELTGEALLRNGSDKGSVTLEFTIDNHTVSITRTLKRGTSITQDTGTITIDGKTTDLGATELKQNIIDLLNYPKELLKKSKNLIYRYTVYTPQEAMKHILLTDAEERIDILRKVFGIDKYKKIQENTLIVISKIKDKRKTNQAKTEDLPRHEERAKKLAQELKKFQQELQNITPQLKTLQTTITNLRTQQNTLELTFQQLRQEEHQQQIIKTQHLLIKNTLTNIQQQLQRLNEEKNIKEIQNPTTSITKIQEHINQLQQQLQTLRQQQANHTLIINQQQTLINQITTLDNCPTCKQNVQEEHKHTITQEGTATITREHIQLQTLQNVLNNKEEELYKQQQTLQQLQTEATNYAVYQQQLQEQQKKEQQKKQLQEQQTQQQKELESVIKQLQQQPATTQNIEQQLIPIKQQLHETQQQERQLAINQASITTKITDYQKEQEQLQTTIKEKQAIKQKNHKLQELQTHLETIFLPLIQSIEKQTMLKVHHDFNTTFTQWFSLLMDTDIITATINHDYQPIITQNSYSIDYEHLSGGEKTACALAYRLALNQVINTLMNTIKTRDLLILDEPTDGFSEEQLDRLKNVLEEVNAQQIIIVSHENKIESFVNNIIHINKKEHTSEVS
ncbi:MAG: AAA family ATPase [Nanoarchaeota archaeon]|nr:AAA family ATPase [Nanoarchaeota archaeon]